MTCPWESALHFEPTCLDHYLYTTRTSIGPLNDRLPQSESLTRTSLSVSESSSTRTFSFRRHTNFSNIIQVVKTRCVYVCSSLYLVSCVWIVSISFRLMSWVFEKVPSSPIPSSHLGCRPFIESYCMHCIVFLFHISLDPHLLRFLSWVSFLRLLLSSFLVCFLSSVLFCPLLSSFFLFYSFFLSLHLLAFSVSPPFFIALSCYG